MSLELAVRIAETLLAFNFALQSLEHMHGLRPEKTIGLINLALSLWLFSGYQPIVAEAGLLVCAGILLRRFQGPYSGGSDAMSGLVLLCLFLSHLAPTRFWQEIALGYLAFQLVFSYFQSGYIKIINAEWRSGLALQDVFAITAYPVSGQVRSLSHSPRLLLMMSWVVILFELAFPLALLNQTALMIALLVAATFHFANAWLFGLNRFFWIWPAAYPVLWWFQSRVLAAH